MSYNNAPRSDTEELLSPSLQEYERRPPIPEQRPWQLESQFWIAFLGGVLPVAAIAYLNGKRLGLPRQRLQLILAVGALGLIATIALAVGVGLRGTAVSARDTTRIARIGSRVIAVLAYLVLFQLQKPADRIYHSYTGGEYASLWKLGLMAVFGLGTLQGMLLAGILAMLGNR